MSYSSDRFQLFHINDVSSTQIRVSYVCPLDSGLRPLLFSLNMLPFGNIIREPHWHTNNDVPFHCCAYDTQLYKTILLPKAYLYGVCSCRVVWWGPNTFLHERFGAWQQNGCPRNPPYTGQIQSIILFKECANASGHDSDWVWWTQMACTVTWLCCKRNIFFSPNHDLISNQNQIVIFLKTN